MALEWPSLNVLVNFCYFNLMGFIRLKKGMIENWFSELRELELWM